MRTLKGDTLRFEFVFFITRLLCLQNFKTLFSLCGLPLVSVMCRENIHNPPRRGTEIRKGGEDVKMRQFPRESGVAYRGLFPGGLSKIGELIMNIMFSFSAEKAISYFTVTGDSKQALLLALIIFYLQSAKCFFQ